MKKVYKGYVIQITPSARGGFQFQCGGDAGAFAMGIARSIEEALNRSIAAIDYPN